MGTKVNRHQTITERRPESVAKTTILDGQLLQIHPVDLGNGLISLCEKTLIVGRENGADILIPESAVSRRHAKFERTPSGISITDLGSTNGTWVNESKIQSCLLESGDRIQFGGRIFKFIATNEVEAQYHEVVYSMMTKDSLTGAWNKRYLMDILRRELRRRARTHRPFSLVMIDIDYFKSINDGHGHLVGDEILSQISKRLLNSIRDEDILARFGGEEFCLVLSETTLAQALLVAERCRVSVCERVYETEAGDISCTISAGVGFVDGEVDMTPDQLLQAADDKLYLAKSLGRNQIQA